MEVAERAAKRAGMVVTSKSSGAAVASSSHVGGAETVAASVGRME